MRKYPTRAALALLLIVANSALAAAADPPGNGDNKPQTATTSTTADEPHIAPDDGDDSNDVAEPDSPNAHKTKAKKKSEPLIIESSHEHDRPLQLALLADFDHVNGFGISGWFAIPVAHDGLLPNINDSLDIELGVLLGLHGYSGLGPSLPVAGTLAILLGPRWNFFFTRSWSVFTTLKFGGVLSDQLWWGSGFDFELAVGTVWQFSSHAGLRLSVGYPMPLGVGLSFDF